MWYNKDMEENNTNTGLEKRDKHDKNNMAKHGGAAGGGMVYILGVVGAAVYYIQQAASFGDGFIGVLKALVWPAFLVYYALQFLGM